MAELTGDARHWSEFGWLAAWTVAIVTAVFLMPDALEQLPQLLAGSMFFAVGLWQRRRGSAASGFLLGGASVLLAVNIVSSVLYGAGMMAASLALDAGGPVTTFVLVVVGWRIRLRDRDLLFEVVIATLAIALAVWRWLLVPGLEAGRVGALEMWMDAVDLTAWGACLAITVGALARQRHRLPVLVVGELLVSIGQFLYAADAAGVLLSSERLKLAFYAAAYAVAPGLFLPSMTRQIMRMPITRGRVGVRWRAALFLVVAISVVFVLASGSAELSYMEVVIVGLLGGLIVGMLGLRLAGGLGADPRPASTAAVPGPPTRAGAAERLAAQWLSSTRAANRPVAAFVLAPGNLMDLELVHGERTRAVLLQVAAHRVERVMGAAGTAAVRPDGGVVALAEVDDLDAAVLAERLLAAFRAPIGTGRGEVLLRCSVGLASAPFARPADQLERLLRDAARAARWAAAAAPGTAISIGQVPALVDYAGEYEERERMLAAVAAGRTRTVLREVVALASGDVVQMRPLLLWEPSPGTWQVVPTGGAQVPNLGPVSHLLLTGLTVMAGRASTLVLNVGPQQLLDPQLRTVLREACARAAVAPSAICWEVIEEDLLVHDDAVLLALDMLVEAGCSVAVGGVGATGGLSLQRLRGLPISQLCLAETFAHQLIQAADHKLARALAAAGQELGWVVSAPLPVDTPDGRRHLRTAGVALAELAPAPSEVMEWP